MTTCANARVKLHSQVYFGLWIKIKKSQPHFVPKKFWFYKDFGSILRQKILVANKFLVQKIFESKKKLLLQKRLCPTFWPTKILTP